MAATTKPAQQEIEGPDAWVSQERLAAFLPPSGSQTRRAPRHREAGDYYSLPRAPPEHTVETNPETFKNLVVKFEEFTRLEEDDVYIIHLK